MRRISTLFALVFVSIVFTLGFASVASADPGVTVEPVTASSPDYSQVTFTNGGKDAVVHYGSAKKNLTEKVSLVPNQVITVTVNDADIIYWQATSESGTSPVHEEDTTDTFALVILLIVLGILFICLVLIVTTPLRY